MKNPISITVSSVCDNGGTADPTFILSDNKNKKTREQLISAKAINSTSSNSINNLCIMPTGSGGSNHYNRRNENSLLPRSRSNSSPGISGHTFLNKKYLQVPKVHTTIQSPDPSIKMYKTKIVSVRTKDKLEDNNHVMYYPNRKLSDSWIGSIEVVDESLLRAGEGDTKVTVEDNFEKSKDKDKTDGSSTSLLGGGKGSFRRSKNKIKSLVTPNYDTNNSKSSGGFSRGSFRKNKDSSKTKSAASSPTSPQQPSVTMETLSKTMPTTSSSSGRGSFRRPKLNLKISGITSKSNKNKDLNNNNLLPISVSNNNISNTILDKIPKINIEHDNNNTTRSPQSAFESAKPTVLRNDIEDFRLKETEIRNMIQDLFNRQLEGVRYEHHINEKRSINLSQQIHDHLKTMTCDKFKFIVSVFIGEIRDQGMETSSQCVWDPKQDCVVMGYHKNDTLFAIAVVFAVALD